MRRAMVLSSLLLAAGARRFRPAKQTYGVKLELGVMVPMRDGVRLSTDVYRPDAPGKFPVVLQRTPYDNGTAGYVKRGRFYASHGFVCVVQDVRGRGDSEGEFYPLRHEAEDGYDAQTWCGTQEWSTGNVGTRGGSYEGWTQVYSAPLNNPYLKAMMPNVTPPDPVKNIPVQYGAYALSMASWLAYTADRTLQDISQHDLMAIYGSLPLSGMDRLLGRNLKVWQDWLAHPGLDDYWRPMCYQEKLVDARVPALHLTGWYDDDQIGTTDNFTAMSQRARDPETRKRQKLVIGPWGHAGSTLGSIDYGPNAMLDLDALPLRWFRRWLLAEDNGIDREPPVRIFVMGANEWRDEQEWPLARTRYTEVLPAQRRPRQQSVRRRRPLARAARRREAGRLRLRPGEPGAVHHRAGVQPGRRPRRLPSGRASRRRPRLLHAATGRADGGVRPVQGEAVRGELREGHRLDRQGARRPPRRLRAAPQRRHHPRPLPQGARPPGAARARQRRGVRDRLLVDVRAARGRAPASPRGRLERVPEVRPQPQHRRPDRHGERDRQGGPDRLPRRGARVVRARPGRAQPAAMPDGPR